MKSLIWPIIFIFTMVMLLGFTTYLFLMMDPQSAIDAASLMTNSIILNS